MNTPWFLHGNCQHAIYKYLKALPHTLLLPASLLLVISPPAWSACVLTPGAGNDAFTCDSGTSGSLTDLAGNNSLTLPTNGTGRINGSVTFGNGTDRVEINSGVITGAVSQGNGIDDFVMSGGSIGSLAQGDSRDTFLMTGGTIVGAFEDGDVARMTDGSIGRVDMKLDNNIFDLSGGQIIGNLVTGFGTDTIIVSGGRVGGNVSVSGGNDSITVTGGEIGGEIRASAGNDTLLWDGDGIIRSAILMDVGNDSATLRNLDDNILALTPSVNGGVGTDVLTFDNTPTALPARFINWETVNLSNGSQLDLGSSSLVLGDAGTGSGVRMSMRAALYSPRKGLLTGSGRASVTFNNAGIIDLTRNNSRTDDTLTVQVTMLAAAGFGGSGQLLLQSVWWR